MDSSNKYLNDVVFKPEIKPSPPKAPLWSNHKVAAENLIMSREFTDLREIDIPDGSDCIIGDDEDLSSENIAILDSHQKVSTSAVVPQGSIEDCDVQIFSKAKPRKQDPQISSSTVLPSEKIETCDVQTFSRAKPRKEEPKNSKWSGKGESLTTEMAVEFMILERKKMDEEQAALRFENERLKREISQRQTSSLNEGGSINSTNNAPAVDENELLRLMEELKRENEALKKHVTAAKDAAVIPAKDTPVRPVIPPLNLQTASMPAYPSSSPLVQKGPLYTNAVADLPNCEKVPKLLWEGGPLWKIPYNGKGNPEHRVVALKRAMQPGIYSRRVQLINQLGEAILPVAGACYISYPQTLVWFTSEKLGEMRNVRELTLYEGTHIVEGHSTPAFRKLANRDGSVPRRELCFSVVTSTRTLDLAAESIDDAEHWKKALTDFLHSVNSSIATSQRVADGSVHPMMPVPPPMPPGAYGGMVPPAPPPPSSARSQTGAAVTMNEEQKRQRKESLKKQMFQCSHVGDYKGLESVLVAGVPVNSMESVTADTPLMIACRKGHASLVRLCLHFGAKNDPHPEFGQTALHAAVEASQIDSAAALLEAAAASQADAIISNLADPKGQTTLHIATTKGDTAMAELLLQHGADITKVELGGMTVIHVSAAGGHKACLAMFMDYGGDALVDETDAEGNTALHLASLYGHLSCVRLLLETAADVFTKNKRNQSAYQLASSRGNHQIGLLLLEYQDINGDLSPRPVPLGPNVAAVYGTSSPAVSARSTSDKSDGGAYAMGLPPYIPSKANGAGSLRLDLVPSGGEYDDESSPSDFSVNVRDMPDSPMRSTELAGFAAGVGTPVLQRSLSSEQLPRPHTASSPLMQHSKAMVTPAKQKTEAQGYRILSSGQKAQGYSQTGYDSPAVPMTARDRASR